MELSVNEQGAPVFRQPERVIFGSGVSSVCVIVCDATFAAEASSSYGSTETVSERMLPVGIALRSATMNGVTVPNAAEPD